MPQRRRNTSLHAKGAVCCQNLAQVDEGKQCNQHSRYASRRFQVFLRVWRQIKAEDIIAEAPAQNRNRLLEALKNQEDTNKAPPAQKKRKSSELHTAIKVRLCAFAAKALLR